MEGEGQISHLAVVVSARILENIEIKWGSASNEIDQYENTLEKGYFSLVGIKSMTFFLGSIYLIPILPPTLTSLQQHPCN